MFWPEAVSVIPAVVSPLQQGVGGVGGGGLVLLLVGGVNSVWNLIRIKPQAIDLH